MNTHQISFAIQGMYCAKCAAKIEIALAQLDGIIAAQVNYASERASVVYDPARVHTAAMIDAVRSVGFDTALEHLTLNVRDLIYASSARTVERVLCRAEGVADVSADLRFGRVNVTALPERASRDYFQVLLTWLGFPSAVGSTSNSPTGFVVRGLLVIGAAILLMMGALVHLGIFAVATELPSPFWLIALAAFALFGAGYPYYRRAFAVLAQGEFDASVLIALATSVAFFGGLVLAPISRDRQVVGVWSAWVAFTFAPILMAGWFIARGLAMWVIPNLRYTALRRDLAAQTAPRSPVTSENGARPDALHRTLDEAPGIAGLNPTPCQAAPALAVLGYSLVIRSDFQWNWSLIQCAEWSSTSRLLQRHQPTRRASTTFVIRSARRSLMPIRCGFFRIRRLKHPALPHPTRMKIGAART